MCVVYLRIQSGFGMHTKQCQMERFGALMPREPRIMQMDWKALGYESRWVDGRLIWEMPTESES